MSVCTISKDDVESLLDISNSFVERLIKNYKDKSVANKTIRL